MAVTRQLLRLRELGISIAAVSAYLDATYNHVYAVLNGITPSRRLLARVDELLDSELVRSMDEKGDANAAV